MSDGRILMSIPILCAQRRAHGFYLRTSGIGIGSSRSTRCLGITRGHMKTKRMTLHLPMNLKTGKIRHSDEGCISPYVLVLVRSGSGFPAVKYTPIQRICLIFASCSLSEKIYLTHRSSPSAFTTPFPFRCCTWHLTVDSWILPKSTPEMRLFTIFGLRFRLARQVRWFLGQCTSTNTVDLLSCLMRWFPRCSESSASTLRVRRLQRQTWPNNRIVQRQRKL